MNYTEMSIIEQTITNGILTVGALALIAGYHVVLNKMSKNKKK